MSEVNKQNLQLAHSAQQPGEKSDHFANQRESLNHHKNSVGRNESRDCI